MADFEYHFNAICFCKGEWMLDNGTSVIHLNWGKNEPNGNTDTIADEDCVFVDVVGILRDYICNGLLYFICQAKR